eukprot:TRINITY_DN80752_c0_g1_i1.p1 TRINITY_DN80752_c0_g1~~TRINITY_DN80752_c0_g1_i1.p1  ORF type:complete len:404 (+),score=67.36 TRINITY_DN80752_c0_g1_i1:36-1247(+)
MAEEGTEHEPDKKKPRMEVHDVIGKSDARWSMACQLFSSGGYGSLTREVQEIHCEREKWNWPQNGFLQTFENVMGKNTRVLMFFPCQILQPHKQDVDQKFHITFGWVDLWKWDETGKPYLQVVKSGDMLELPAGTVLGLRVGTQGMSLHETTTSNSLQKCPTQFMDYHMPSVFQDKTVFITGSNRGLGNGFATLLRKEGAHVVDSCRTPKDKEIALDISDEMSVATLPDRLQAAGITGIDYLINNAGISVPNHPVDPVVGLDIQEARKVLDTNVLGTINATNRLIPLMETRSTRVCIALSSQLASIENCWGIQGKYGGVASYRMSRAALNMAMRCFGGELKDAGYIFVSMSPGHVQTDMGSSGGRSAPLSVEESVGGMMDVMRGLSSASNGCFLQYDNTVLPW